METIEIRPAVNRNELEQAYDIWGSVFPEDRSFFQQRLDHDHTYKLDTTWLAIVSGKIAAAIQIFPYRMRWGSVSLKVGGIGNVATLPEYRRRGLAQEVLRRLCSYMRTRGYDLSLLMTGINSFYEQIGWRTIEDPEWIADAAVLRRSASAGSSRIRVYEESDLDRIGSIYDEMNRDWIAPMVRSKLYWQGQAAWKTVRPEHFLVAEEDGQIVGYLRFKVQNDQLDIKDCCYAAGREQAALGLLQGALTAEPQATSVRAGLPFGHALHDFLQEIGAETEKVAYKMWRTFDLNATLRKLTPELARRIRESAANGNMQLPAALLFVVGGEESLLTVSADAVEAVPVTEHVSYNEVVELTDEEWITLLLKGIDELELRERRGAQYLRSLFPKRPYVFWHADHF